MKKVIFVASTSYSGSTFLDMTLGNDAAGFSIGEVNALFSPTRKHHYRPVCGCYQPQCTLWQELSQQPVAQLYQNIFEKYPELEFIVDSSKDPFWIQSRIQDLKNQGIDYRIAVIWKSPLEIANSFQKRDNLQLWERHWVNYYRLLYTLQPDNWVTINYLEYVSNPLSLKDFCKGLDIPYFEGKSQFWEKTHHILFGNHSARKHLLKNHKDNQIDGALDTFQQVVYKPVQDPELQQIVDEAMRQNPKIKVMQTILESLTQGNSLSSKFDDIRLNPQQVILRRIKQKLLLIRGRFLKPSD